MIISILIVVRNAKDNIVNCIQSIESQFQGNYKEWELIIVDGMSVDGSKEVATQYLKNKKYSWAVLDNPKKILASGWNIGIKAAKGDYVLRPDVHATLHEGYISNGLKVLADQPDVTAVGGALQTQSKGFGGRLLQRHYHQKLGLGDHHFEQMQLMVWLILLRMAFIENLYLIWLVILTRILNGTKTTICMIALKKLAEHFTFSDK